MKTLVIALKNKDKWRLECLKEWILSALEDWTKDNEPAMKGTTVDVEIKR